ncbi:Crp/Fnr family transcriptional regulator [Paenibacillus phocaensis]|uniref:Crp/Fnr family transcriptional regulator n=1 Tax=Paenibacillus phocaensis TaxID=1776378 RepID=UPI000839BE04|nr:Crp/Fnr family transcriptional regulator [Paenibacillus phocaensis]
MDHSTQLLRSFPLFQGLSAEEAARIGALVVPRLLARRAAVFREGDEVEAVYFVANGLIKTSRTDERGNEQIFSFLKQGDMFPLTGRFDAEASPVTATTVVETSLLAIPLRSFEQLLAGSPELAFKMMGLMSGKIRELQSKLLNLNQRSAEERGISFLISLAEHFGVERGGEVVVPIPVTHQELASTIGFARETVSRLLTSLRKEGVLQVSRKGFVVRDLQALKEKVCVKENCPHCRELQRLRQG